VIVMFKKDLQQPFQTLSFNAPQTAESFIITGLDPATSYKVDKVAQLDGSWLVTVSLGTGSLSDAGGAITIGELAAENPDNITGTEMSIGEESVTVWPNPAQERVAIKSSYPMKEIRMLDPRGNVIRKNQINNLMETSLYVGDVNKGIYLIQLRTNKGLVTKKIIKQ
jgi:type IX secretion system substrate protein